MAAREQPAQYERDTNTRMIRCGLIDEKTLTLRGWPGDRTRLGRSGYAPLDTEFELAHMGGVVLECFSQPIGLGAR
ncbi:MAG: hypothetical protein P8Z00_01820 [Anaerolineales bacterium]|jgi:hypothetical protein